MRRMIKHILEKIRHSQVGSATIEAVISFTGFLFVIFTILNIVNLCRAQMLVSNAMDTVTKELTQYSYFYQISGLRKFDQEIQAIGDKNSVSLNNLASSVGDLYNALGTAASSGEEEIRGLNNSLREGSLTSDGVQAVLLNLDTDASNVTASIEKVEAQIGDLIDNPVTYLKSIVAVAGSQGLDTLKSHVIAAPLAKSLMVKHFGHNRTEANAVLERLGIVGGLDGMNFTRSTIFQEDHPEEIHLAVYYKVKVVQLFKWADFEATICKETRARAWLGGDDVQCMVVSTISASESTGGDETRGIGETSSVEGDDEEGSGDDEEPPSEDPIKQELLAEYPAEVIEAISQGQDTSSWTEDEWYYRIWCYVNGNLSPSGKTLKQYMIFLLGEEQVNSISAGEDTSNWTIYDWYNANFIFMSNLGQTQPPQENEPTPTEEPKEPPEDPSVVENVIIRDGSHMEDGKLKPNVTYQTGEYEYYYSTDEYGRLSSWTTDELHLTERKERLPHDPNTPGKEPGDHAGHLAGDRFGGSPSVDNIVSQSQHVNLSEYKKIENIWAKALKENKHVTVDVQIVYEGDSLRPSSFIVKYTIDGEWFKAEIENK